MRVALVHDWLTGMRGGEKVLEEFCAMLPEADLFTLVHVPGSVSPGIEAHRITASPLSRVPGIERTYRKFLPFFPALVGAFDLSRYDLVLSTSSCVAKGARPAPGARHVSYVFTPMRYIWDRYDDYFGPGKAGTATRLAMRLVRGPLRRWDVASSSRVHAFVADSAFVAERIRALYGRASDVVAPPVDVERFRPASAPPTGEWLVVSAFAPYKRLDVAIAAAAQAGVALAVVGKGPEEARLRALAGPRTRFLGWLDDDALARAYAACRGLLFPGVEDFGITPEEAMACGRPVVAYAAGGALETVVGAAWEGDPGGAAVGGTGLFVREQTPEAFARAIRAVESIAPRAWEEAGRARALEFRPEVFRTKMRGILEREAAHLGRGPAVESSIDRSIDAPLPRWDSRQRPPREEEHV